MRAWAIRHLQVFFYSLGQLWRTRWGTLMSVAVIAISLTLPAAFYLLLQLTDQLSSGLQNGAEVSLFLAPEVSEQEAKTLADSIRQRPEVAAVDYVSAAAALAEFRAQSGFGMALDLLDENPLPPLLRVTPRADGASPEQVARWLAEFRAMPAVESAEFDFAWVQRFQGMVEIGRRLAMIFTLLLGGGVVLIIGNTIRLAIFNRRDEIEISKLIGATEAFIRRPFLYSGLQQGALGGLLALLMVYAALVTLAPPVNRLAGFYQSDFSLQVLSWLELLVLPLLGALLGYAGAWLAVGRHLREIEPR